MGRTRRLDVVVTPRASIWAYSSCRVLTIWASGEIVLPPPLHRVIVVPLWKSIPPLRSKNVLYLSEDRLIRQTFWNDKPLRWQNSLSMESGPGFELVKLWSQRGRRVSAPLKSLKFGSGSSAMSFPTTIFESSSRRRVNPLTFQRTGPKLRSASRYCYRISIVDTCTGDWKPLLGRYTPPKSLDKLCQYVWIIELSPRGLFISGGLFPPSQSFLWIINWTRGRVRRRIHTKNGQSTSLVPG